MKTNGITLIALVVTIVVLIILATISINAVLGENGIIKRAESARQHQLNAEASDNEELDELDKLLEDYTPGEKIYAKMYSLNDGTGDVLVLSSNKEYTDTEGLTLKEDYGNIAGERYYYDDIYKDYYDEEIEEWIYHYEVTGNMPPWLEKYSDIEGETYIEIYYENNDLIEVRIADEISPISTACYFACCNNLKEIKGIENLNTANVTDMTRMFISCAELTSLDVSGFDTSNVTDMSGMFRNCKRLTSLDVSGFDTSKVQDMGYMFSGCSGLTSLDVKNFNTTNVTNMNSMFYRCRNLTSLDMSGFDTSKVTNMYDMFDSCKGLTSLDITNFDTTNVTTMSGMFENCKGLTSIDLSKLDTSNVTDMCAMFSRL